MWCKVSDHSPVTFTVTTKVKIKDMRRRVVKAFFMPPKAIEREKKEYRSGEVDILEVIEKLEPGAETAAKDIFIKLERFIISPLQTRI